MSNSGLRSERNRAPRPRLSALGVLGELLVTAGLFTFAFLGWQLWLNDIILGSAQRDQALMLSEKFLNAASPEKPGSATKVSVSPSPSSFDSGALGAGSSGAGSVGDAGMTAGHPGSAMTTAVAGSDQKFANVYIPRFGDDYVRTIAEGVDTGVALRSGIGHYPGTQMPGEIGNFALAAHRTTFGAPFNRMASLQLGDRIYVQTASGWYTYVFRSMEYVQPRDVAVTAPVPQRAGLAAQDRILTMTSCNPQLSAAERIVAYSVFDSWQSLTAGAPAPVRALAEGRN
ncbi:MAG: class E sortase [Microbacteriaceae bacterium]|nr:class E sortase [Microbacteriaceae bacterium]